MKRRDFLKLTAAASFTAAASACNAASAASSGPGLSLTTTAMTAAANGQTTRAWEETVRTMYPSACWPAGFPWIHRGDAVWKWYGDIVANDQTASGRSSSWSGVDEFLAYAAGNRGYVLAALTDAPCETSQPGNLIQMGEGGDWRHVVIISRPVQDTEGQTIDYLVRSNTSDLENWPASLYGCPELALTRIAGWND